MDNDQQNNVNRPRQTTYFTPTHLSTARLIRKLIKPFKNIYTEDSNGSGSIFYNVGKH